MLRTSWVVFLLMGLASMLAFVDSLRATDELLFPGAVTYSWNGTPPLVKPDLDIQTAHGGDEALGNSSGQGSWNMSVVRYSELPGAEPDRKHKHKPPKRDHDPIPESWGVFDSLGFFALALLAFGMVIRLRVLRTFVA
jgi:hypothetical protein